MRPDWLSRIETLGTTAVVLMVGSMMIWYEAVERERRLAFTIGSAVLLYVVALVRVRAALGALPASRGGPSPSPDWPPGPSPS